MEKDNKNKIILAILILFFLVSILSFSTYLYLNKKESKLEKTQLKDGKTFIKKVSNYSIYIDTYGKMYYVYDEENNEFFAYLDETNNENYLRFTEDKKEKIINIKDSILLEGGAFSCRFFSANSYSICMDDTIIEESNKFGVVSLKTGETLIDRKYDQISQDKNGNFLVKLNDKYGLFSIKGEILLEVKYDYLGYSEETGYITILGNNLVSYDKDIKEKTFPTDIRGTVAITNSSSFYFSGGSVLVYQDINKGLQGPKYSGTTYTGNQLIIYDVYSGCYGDSIMYVIKDSKANKISSNEVSKLTNCF